MGKLILYSLVAHLIILGIIFTVPMVSEKREKPKDVYRVSFVELPRNPAEKKEVNKPQPNKKKESPEPKQVAVKKPSVAPLPEKLKVKKEPEKIPERRKKEKFKKSRNRQQQKQPKLETKGKEQKEKLTEFSTTTTASLGPKGVGSLSLEDVDFPYSYYLSIMQRRIAEHWDPVYSEFEGKGGRRVVIFFKVQRDGSIEGLKIEKSSGDEFLDGSAAMAIMKAGPLPPLPYEFEGEELRVHFGFEYSGEG